ncbi:glycoside hydrolase [Rhizoclosmatium globosum]|uniref:Glycoside hydrolase n=1 Tax=Rhizoclosmatium globosum TaxID=329046 RepID=A0A1Y2CQD1_9FUNG|nr:glycoside hydrolase [Rhizoclosmatium globosum]|eukprot:ORY49167.1 glycoside hydrolase [Rhizoclosmatium globosum]
MAYEEIPLDKAPVVEDATVKASSNKKKIIIAASVILVIAIAGGLAGYFVSKNNNSSSNSSNSSNPSNPSPTTTPTGPVGKKKLIGYWGQNAANNQLDIVKGYGGRALNPALDQNTLDYYCNLNYYDTINLSFLTEFGGGDNHFTINFANLGLYKWDGKVQTSGYDSMNKVGVSIKKCQALGIKVLISLGGDKVSNYSFAAGDGKKYANLFYNAFLGGNTDPTAPKPFGADVTLDGIELDIEKNPTDVVPAIPNANPSGWTSEMVIFVQTLKQLKPTALLAAVPQCSLAVPGYLGKDRNMGDLLAQTPSSFDYIIVQYYNNIECTYPFGFNYNKWKTLYPGQIYLGLPGGWLSAISGGFLEPNSLQAVYDMVKYDSQFAGVSVYDVSSSNPPGLDADAVNYANPPESHYSETLYKLVQGQTVGSGMPASSVALVETDFAYRCGGTWVYANATCSNKVCYPYQSVTGCGATEQCFRFIAKC